MADPEPRPRDALHPPAASDDLTGEAALRAILPTLEALPAASIIRPNASVAVVVATLFEIVRVLREPARVERFALLDPSLVPRDAADQLDTLARALWYLDTRARSVAASTTAVRVDPAIIADARDTHARMLAVLAYHFGDQPVWKPEVADLRRPRSHLDLAACLTRLAGHHRVHRATLMHDVARYREDDARHAESLVHAILTSLERSEPHPTADLRARCWTRVASLYGDVRAAVLFLYRHEPHELARFPGLPMVGKKRRGALPKNKQPQADSAPSDASDNTQPDEPDSRDARDVQPNESDPS